MTDNGQGFYTVIPAIRGTQAGQDYFVALCPLGVLPRLLVSQGAMLEPEHRAQRILNRARIPELKRYILDNPDSYVLSALTVSVDGALVFKPLEETGAGVTIGNLCIPMEATLLVNDGQHRYAAITEALRERPELGQETVAVIFLRDHGLRRSQQLFSDLNKYAVKPGRSLNILYDHRDFTAEVVRRLVDNAAVFRGLVEKERTSLSLRSQKLFTLSAIHRATIPVLESLPADQDGIDAAAAACGDFWEIVGDGMEEWQAVQSGQMRAAQVRQDYVHSSGVILQALGRVGAWLFDLPESDRRFYCSRLRYIDWRKENRDWEGVILFQGRLKNGLDNVRLAAEYIARQIGLPGLNEHGKRDGCSLHITEPGGLRQ